MRVAWKERSDLPRVCLGVGFESRCEKAIPLFGNRLFAVVLEPLELVVHGSTVRSTHHPTEQEEEDLEPPLGLHIGSLSYASPRAKVFEFVLDHQVEHLPSQVNGAHERSFIPGDDTPQLHAFAALFSHGHEGGANTFSLLLDDAVFDHDLAPLRDVVERPLEDTRDRSVYFDLAFVSHL